MVVFSIPVAAQEFSTKKITKTLPEKLLEQQFDPDLHNADDTEMANRYYAACLQQKIPLLSARSIEEFCACSAAEVAATMSADNIRALSYDTAEGRKQRTRLADLAYAPCLSYPAQDLLEKNCLTNPEIVNTLTRYKGVCACIAEGTAAYAKDRAHTLIFRQVRQKGYAEPDLAEMLTALLESEPFQRGADYQAKRCTQRIELGW